MANIHIEIDKRLKKEAKTKAARMEVSLKEILTLLLRKWVKGEFKNGISSKT